MAAAGSQQDVLFMMYLFLNCNEFNYSVKNCKKKKKPKYEFPFLLWFQNLREWRFLKSEVSFEIGKLKFICAARCDCLHHED